MNIDIKHKTSNIGIYNRHIMACKECGTKLDLSWCKDIVGFNYPTNKPINSLRPLIVVSRCSNCGLLQWSHAGWSLYELYKNRMDAKK